VGQCVTEPSKAGTPLGQEDSYELDASMKRLEGAGVCIAVWEDGSMRVLVTEEDDTLKAIDDGGTIYSPHDMLMYVTLPERERRILQAFTKRFGGTIELRQGGANDSKQTCPNKSFPGANTVRDVF
jgi:hypothetical protein